jgi:hypothetical protein
LNRSLPLRRGRPSARALTGLAAVLFLVACTSSLGRYASWSRTRLAAEQWPERVLRLVAGPAAGWLPGALSSTDRDAGLVYVTDRMADPDWLAAYYLYPRSLHVRDSRILREPSLRARARAQGLPLALHRGRLLALPGLEEITAPDTEPLDFPPPGPTTRGWIALGLLVASALGWGGTVLALTRGRAALSPTAAGRVGLALLAGLGVLGTVGFFAALVGLAAHPFLAWGLTAAGVVLLPLLWRKRRALSHASATSPPSEPGRDEGHSPETVPAGQRAPGRTATVARENLLVLGAPGTARLLGVLLLLVIALLVTGALIRAVGEPMHHWDERFQWAYKGKILLAEGGIHGPTFQEPDRPHLHRRYPLLLPALEAHLARLAGGFHQERIVKALFPLFFVGFLLVTHAALRSRLAALPALLLTALLAALPPLHHATRIQGGPVHTGFADLPLAAWLAAATLVLLPLLPRPRGRLADRCSTPLSGEGPRYAGRAPGLVAFFAGLAFLTKPEGAAVLLSVVLVAALATLRHRRSARVDGQRQRPSGQSGPAGSFAPWIVAAAVLLLVVLPQIVLIVEAPTVGTVGDTGDEDYLARLRPARLAEGLRNNLAPALAAIIAAPFTFRWAFFGLLPLAGASLALLSRRRGGHLLLLLVLGPLAADLLAFVLTGSDVRWHLAVALDRLWMQVLSPVFVIIAGQIHRLASDPVSVDAS